MSPDLVELNVWIGTSVSAFLTCADEPYDKIRDLDEKMCPQSCTGNPF
jgi:hypothetical protein